VDYRKSLTALLTAFALLLFAGSAAGSVDKYFSAGGARFTLQSENGYTIAVERFRRRVTLSAVRGGKSFFAATSYTVPSKVLPQRIDARFGKFGRISVRLRTERMHKGELEEQCTGRPETVRYGVFVGTIRFRGEGGYTSVDARHAKGQWNSGERIKCVFPNLRPVLGRWLMCLARFHRRSVRSRAVIAASESNSPRGSAGRFSSRRSRRSDVGGSVFSEMSSLRRRRPVSTSPLTSPRQRSVLPGHFRVKRASSGRLSVPLGQER
jgi:hypothetical protein